MFDEKIIADLVRHMRGAKGDNVEARQRFITLVGGNPDITPAALRNEAQDELAEYLERLLNGG